ncbi:MAG: glycosyltransferase family 2 protein [Actinobacteria bacterium]|nr:glycosyltransferase family 2 protein [Actinomycetota bacterium]
MDAPRRSDVLVLVPALNEQETVAAVVSSARACLDCDVLVINDGSSDRTAEEALSAGAMVIDHPFNLGVGAAIRTGLRVAAAQGRAFVIQLDADGQHEPAEARRLLDQVRDGSADLVVGSRFESGYRVSRLRGAMMSALSWVVSRRVGTPVDDTTSGFRAFGPAAISLFARYYPTVYLSDTVEALLLASDADLRVRVVPVKMHPRQGGEPSSKRLRSAVQLTRLWLVILMHPIRRAPIQRGLPHVA